MTVGKRLIAIGWTLLCPGAGQGVAGRRLSARAWAAAGLAAVLAMPFTIWGFFAALLLRLASAAHAALLLRRAREARLAWNQDTGAATGAAIAAIVFWAVFLARLRIPSSSMLPTLQVDDLVYAERLTLLWRSPDRGEVVVYQMPCMRQRDYIGRVMAVGGDKIEIRCSVVYVNGAPIPSELVDPECEYRDRSEGDASWRAVPCSRYRETHGGYTYDVLYDPDRPSRMQAGRPVGDDADFPRGLAPHCPLAPSDMGDPSSLQPQGRIEITKTGATACEPQAHFEVPPDSLFILGDHRYNSNDSRYWGVVPVAFVNARLVGVYRPLSNAGDR